MNQILEKNVFATCTLVGWNRAEIMYHIRHRVGQCVVCYHNGERHTLDKSKRGSYISITINTSAFQCAREAVEFYWYNDIKDTLSIVPDLSNAANTYTIMELYKVL